MTAVLKLFLSLALFSAFVAGASAQDRPASPVSPASIAPFASPASPAVPQAKSPFELVRSLQVVQDQMVLGGNDAKNKLPKLVAQIAERMLAADPAVWKQSKNTLAAMIYTLSGGQPRVGRRIIELNVSPERELVLLEGAVAYVEGREARAKQLLSPIDAKALPTSAGGHVALVQAALIAKEDPPKAVQLLDLARILGPGTLVEEAALRREAFLASETGDFDKFSSLSAQYFRRFRKSVYADPFRDRFQEAAAHWGLNSGAEQFSKVEKLLGELDSAEQLKLYLGIAESGLINGKIGAARAAAGKAGRLSKVDSAEGARSKLYEAAALILTNDLEGGLGELEGVDGSRLSKADAQLKEAVAGIAKAIRQGPEDLEARPVPGGAAGPRGGGRASASAAALIDRAQGAIDQTDGLLRRTAP